MNYSVFKVQQQQGGKSGIFWEKETIPKKDRKFGYKKKEQRFPIRRHPNDTHYVDTGLETLTPDEAPVKKPPAKDFIKRNRQKVTQKKIPDANQTVTLTQEQLNAILKSVGKVAGGREAALKISIDGNDDKKEITIESPRHHDDRRDDRHDEDRRHRSKGRPKKVEKREEDEEEEGGSIYALLGDRDKHRDKDDRRSRAKVDSKNSLERRGHSKRNDNYDSEDDERGNRRRGHSKKRSDYDEEDDDRDYRGRKKGSRYSDDENVDDYLDSKSKKRVSKGRKDYDDDEDENNDNNSSKRKNFSKRGHRHNDDDDDLSDNDKDYRRHRDNRHKNRHRQDSDSRERTKKDSVDKETRKTSRDREDALNASLEEGGKTPRDAVGIPSDLSWRHMTKAERYRLMLARQKLSDEEERKEEERIHNMMAKLQDLPTMNTKRRVVRSDPASREAAHGESRLLLEDVRNDHHPRRRAARSPPADKRSRTPDRSPDPHRSPEGSPLEKLPIPKQHLTLAEKKRLEWERDRVESVQIQRRGDYDPWGRPGAGAPLRTKSGHVAADYKNRKEHMHGTDPIPEDDTPDKNKSEPAQDPPTSQAPPTNTRQPLPQGRLDDSDVPHAMRSSFVFGQAYPDADRFTNKREEEKKQWLADLEKQIEEKRQKELKNAEVKQEDNTWAEKLGQSHRPVPFPEQPRTTAPAVGDSIDRTHSAPENTGAVEESSTFIRGQNVPVDPITKKELEEKRKQYLEYQMALKAQVNEKERQKQLERQKKLQEDLEEEKKLREEREFLQRQFDMEQQKIRQKEQQRQNQVNMLKVAMDEAQAKAMQEKYQRKMQHLERGGHDTTKLRENLEAKVTPRDEGSVMGADSSYVPGLDLNTSRTNLPLQGLHTTSVPAMTDTRRDGQSAHEPYTENRVLTPTRLRGAPSKPWSDPSSPRREFGTQTGNASQHEAEDHMLDDVDEAVALLNRSLDREMSQVNIEYRMEKGKRVRVVSAPKEEVTRKARMKQPHPPPPRHASPHQHHHEEMKKKELDAEIRKRQLEQKRKGPVRAGSRPLWNYRNADLKKAAKQSEKDPFYERKKRESEARRLKREAKLLALVDANRGLIPDYYNPAERSRNASPHSDFGGESPRNKTVKRRSKSHSPIRSLEESDYIVVHQEPSVFPLKSKTPTRNSPQSPPLHMPHPPQAENPHSRSPLVPALKHRLNANDNNLEDPVERNDISRRPGKTNYGDIDPVSGPLQNSDFVPFTRTIDVLDPKKADEPMPVSREATKIANARRAYHEGLNPDRYGNRVDMYKDQQRNPAADPNERNPLLKPSLVTEHPTARQDQILMQLSSLKQSLMQRQRELETFSPTDFT